MNIAKKLIVVLTLAVLPSLFAQVPLYTGDPRCPNGQCGAYGLGEAQGNMLNNPQCPQQAMPYTGSLGPAQFPSGVQQYNVPGSPFYGH
jgi:hypothetical protein